MLDKLDSIAVRVLDHHQPAIGAALNVRIALIDEFFSARRILGT
ncbi:MAG: hypothetical protein AB7P23_07330 [Amphiplicatus sp.]